MRLVSVDKINSGEILAQPILGDDGFMLLKDGVCLNDRYKNRLGEMGISYIYVEHPKLEDIKPQDINFFEIKRDAIKALTNVYKRIQYNDASAVLNLLNVVGTIADYIVSNKNLDIAYLVELKTKGNQIFVHSLNTCVLSIVLGVNMSYARNMLVDLGMGAIMMDIGKIKIAEGNPNKLTAGQSEDVEAMKKHPLYGYDILKDIREISTISKAVVLEHHERMDGGGYPRGIRDDKISKYARIVSICEMYDSILSSNINNKRYSVNEAYELVLGGSGTIFDSDFVNVFRNSISVYPLGVGVRLSNGELGFVIGQNKGFPDRPILRVLYDKYDRVISPYEVDLIRKIDLRIEQIVI